MKIFRQIVILFFMISAWAASAQRDTLLMDNNEFLIGEIKSLDENVVIIETDYSDKDFQVEWDKVVTINTVSSFIVITSDGERFVGRIKSHEKNPALVIIEDKAAGFPVVNINHILFLKELDDTFWTRSDFKISAGYMLTKANNSHQFSGNLMSGYMTSKYRTDFSLGAIRTLQTDQEVTSKVSRTEAGLGIIYFIKNDWFGVVRSDLLESSEQKLKIRALTRGGAGYYFFKNNKMNFGGIAGAAWNVENYEELSQANRNSLEAFAGIEYKIFNLGDLDFLSRVVAYPSLTQKKRFRTDLDFSLEYEFDFDLFINLGFTLNYDNKPAEGASQNDYVLSTSIGWSL